MRLVIDLENEKSWPLEIRRQFDANFDLFARYEAERIRLFELYQRDWFAHQREGGNRFSEDRKRVIELVTEIASPHHLSGFHCTRLCPDEIDAIRLGGMTPASADFLAKRIAVRAAAGDISDSLATRLTGRNLAAEIYRTNMIWFVNGSSILRDQSGLYRLFRHWGGEALYGLYERDKEISPVLKRLGQPCIVEAVLPIANFTHFSLIGEPMYSSFMLSRGIKPDRLPGMEGNMKSPIPASDITRIVTYDSPEFELLTNSSTWHEVIA
jgi:hypothetical protein